MGHVDKNNGKVKAIKHVGDWGEAQIMDMIWNKAEDDFGCIGAVSFCDEIIDKLMHRDVFVDNAGHDCEPPDYYSDVEDIMFDVTRVNDSEYKKGKNPIFQEMAMHVKQAETMLDRCGIEGVTHVLSDLSGDDAETYGDYHKFEYYKRHVNRVLFDHISKIGIWREQHPSITHRGLVVCDEVEVYLHANADGIVDDVYQSWADKDVMSLFLQADLDFVVWFYPYMKKSAMDVMSDGHYPSVVLMDVRDGALYDLRTYVDDGSWCSGLCVEKVVIDDAN